MQHRLALLVLIALSMSSALAAEYRLGALRISHLHVRATAPGQSSAAVYATIENSGRSPDRLLTITTPAAASAQLHTMSMEGDVMKMRDVDALTLPPATPVAMAAGKGAHIMLTQLRHPLVHGQQIALTLTFQHAGSIKTYVNVDALTSVP